MMSAPSLKASVVRAEITPPVGIPMEGYGAREQVSQGVHDPLHAELLLFEGSSQRILLISLDLLGIRLPITEAVRAGIEQATGIPANGIMLACSHTHSGPAGFLPDLPGLKTHSAPEYQLAVIEKVIQAAEEAVQRLKPVRIGWASGRVRGIGTNRNEPLSASLDDELLILRVEDPTGTPLAVVMNYGCHPTVLGHENLMLSADFPGATRAALQKVYPETVFLFTNGASGDISTRFTRREQTFAEVTRIGYILAGGVLETMQKVETTESATLDNRIKQLEIPFRSFPSPEQSRAKIEDLQDRLDSMKAEGVSHGDLRRIFTQWQGAVGQAEMAKLLSGAGSLQTQLQTLTIGDGTLVGVPGEPFTSSVLRIKEASPFEITCVVSYCNDEVGYFPDASAFQDETYEALISPFEEQVATLVEDQSLALIQEAYHART
jgi:neutral ceramidase